MTWKVEEFNYRRPVATPKKASYATGLINAKLSAAAIIEDLRPNSNKVPNCRTKIFTAKFLWNSKFNLFGIFIISIIIITIIITISVWRPCRSGRSQGDVTCWTTWCSCAQGTMKKRLFVMAAYQCGPPLTLNWRPLNHRGSTLLADQHNTHIQTHGSSISKTATGPLIMMIIITTYL